MEFGDFAAGQLCRADQQPELGLGIIERIEGRRLVVHYRLIGERRIYALHNAPISRVRFRAGAELATDSGTLIVGSIDDSKALISYIGTDEAGATASVLESQVQSGPSQDDCLERWLSGRIDSIKQTALRSETTEILHQHRQSAAFGITGARIELLPHQLFIADGVARREAPRVLLADEVGLGKSIEAGLVLHQRMLAGTTTRALIVVPEPLLNQWLIELVRRFALDVTVLGPSREEIAPGTGDSFQEGSTVLCPQAWLLESESRVLEAAIAGFDLLIVDEAHHLKWSESGASFEYEAVARLADSIAAVLLLTATPEQLGADAHFARLRLLDPQRYASLEAFRKEESQYLELSQLIADLQSADGDWDPSVFDRVEAVLGRPARQQLADDQSAVEELVAQLLDRHGTGRVMFRNTRQAVGGFPRREVHPWPVAEAPASDGNGRPENDPRVVWLVAWLKQHRDQRVLLITASADDAMALSDHLRRAEGMRSAAYHEHLSLLERDRAAAYFTDSDQGAQILVCSEIGSEGRNFQRANHLILFGLPLEPDLLEQRIGRIDRIGQKQTVHIHVPYLAASTDAQLFRWYHEGLDAFVHVNDVGSRLGEELLALRDQCLSGQVTLDRLLKDTRARRTEVQRELTAGRNRLLELNSLDPNRATQLVAAVADASRSRPVADYLERLFDVVGVDSEDDGRGGLIVRPTDHMRLEQFPGLTEDGLTATTDRSTALAREDIAFLTWEHPLVAAPMEAIAHSNIGSAAMVTVDHPGLVAGTLLVETVYRVRSPAPRALGVERFLEAPVIRVLLDGSGSDRTESITHRQLGRWARRVDKETMRLFVRQAREPVISAVKESRELAEKQLRNVVTAAKTLADDEFSTEIERLVALAKVNPNVTDDDVDDLRRRHQAIDGYLARAALDLDALRVAMVVG